MRITIAGGGLAGPLMACMLVRHGHRITVLEQRSDPRRQGYAGGRSINLALSERGLEALRIVGLESQVLDMTIPMRGRRMHDRSGNLSFQPYSVIPGEAIRSVSRGGLNMLLLEAADAHDNVELCFDTQCIDVDPSSGMTTFERNGGTETIEADLVIGADGAGSAIRDAIVRQGVLECSRELIDSGYKELTIPPSGSGDAAIAPDALHIWPRGHLMMIALPNLDRSFTCTLFWPFEGSESFAAIDGRDDILPFFQRLFPDSVALMPALEDEYEHNPVGELGTIRCTQFHHGRVVLLGDAAHAIVPFYGQGMNAAFQDCTVLDDLLQKHDLEDALQEFSRLQKPNADAIADLALTNFIEMRNRVASPIFRIRQRIAKQLNRLLPGTFVPLYNMVSFTTIPYTEAVRIARARRRRFAGLTLCLLVVVIIILTAWLASITP